MFSSVARHFNGTGECGVLIFDIPSATLGTWFREFPSSPDPSSRGVWVRLFGSEGDVLYENNQDVVAGGYSLECHETFTFTFAVLSSGTQWTALACETEDAYSDRQSYASLGATYVVC